MVTNCVGGEWDIGSTPSARACILYGAAAVRHQVLGRSVTGTNSESYHSPSVVGLEVRVHESNGVGRQTKRCFHIRNVGVSRRIGYPRRKGVNGPALHRSCVRVIGGWYE